MNDDRRVELLQALAALDELRVLAAAAAPGVELLLQAMAESEMRTDQMHKALGLPVTVVRWCRRQREQLEQGDHRQQQALAAAEQHLLDLTQQ